MIMIKNRPIYGRLKYYKSLKFEVGIQKHYD